MDDKHIHGDNLRGREIIKDYLMKDILSVSCETNEDREVENNFELILWVYRKRTTNRGCKREPVEERELVNIKFSTSTLDNTARWAAYIQC
mmetsp:Transcript_34564/g.33768  ORF Transcript_34564/g.33768 Transcript_34564/m.33768 type:complete len:91 (+) Transcript_34564:266-538(+)